MPDFVLLGAAMIAEPNRMSVVSAEFGTEFC